MATSGRGLRSALHDAAATSPDSAAYRQRVLDVLRERVPFDAACLGGIDPAALLPTSLTTVGYGPGVYPTVFDIEYGDSQDEPSRFAALRRRRVPLRTLREATGGRVRTSRFYADVLAPSGLSDEVRMLFRDHDGHCWGALTLARAPGRDFDDVEVAALAAVLPDVADGLRTVLFRDSVCGTLPLVDGPAMAVVGPDDELESVTPGGLEYLDRLGWLSHNRPLALSPAAAVATWLRHSGQGSIVVRVRTVSGQWVVVRAGRFAGEHPSRRVVLTMEQAQVPQIASLAALAHGLTPREAEVLIHVLAGESREEMAQTLFISPYTVQDHLKNIYAKTGVTSRRALVTMLVQRQYLPRLGSPVGADGWFATARQHGAAPARSQRPTTPASGTRLTPIASNVPTQTRR